MRYILGKLLQLQRLKVDAAALVRYHRVRIERAALRQASRLAAQILLQFQYRDNLEVAAALAHGALARKLKTIEASTQWNVCLAVAAVCARNC